MPGHDQQCDLEDDDFWPNISSGTHHHDNTILLYCKRVRIDIGARDKRKFGRVLEKSVCLRTVSLVNLLARIKLAEYNNIMALCFASLLYYYFYYYFVHIWGAVRPGNISIITIIIRLYTTCSRAPVYKI